MTPLLLLWLQQAAHAAPASPASPTAGVFSELLRVLVVLALVSALAFWGLRWLARRGGFGSQLPAGEHGPQLKVLARVPLEPRKALYLVQAGERTLLLGTGEGGPPSLLVDLGAAGTAVAGGTDARASGVAAGNAGERGDG